MRMLKEIGQYRDLLWMLTFRDIRIRYKQAVMGFMWAIFMPVVAISAGLLIKTAMAVVSGKPMEWSGIVSISVKVLPWTFFINAVKFSVNSLVGNSALITKIYFPREILPISSVLACSFDFVIGMATLGILLAIAHIGISIHILFVPLILFFLVLFTMGLGLLLSLSNLFFRDVKYIVEIILMFGIFFTPVFYEASTFGKWKTILMINPVAGILEALNNVVVLHKMPEIFWLAYSGVSAISLFMISYLVFHKMESLFAENI
ncbi:MAG: ABC transporter permease [Candidatus Omnitrophica bacterium]|nr:ABC transporter permease [Candidatus Omnitrophota bacterium]